jgi:hypothetical protein
MVLSVLLHRQRKAASAQLLIITYKTVCEVEHFNLHANMALG